MKHSGTFVRLLLIWVVVWGAGRASEAETKKLSNSIADVMLPDKELKAALQEIDSTDVDLVEKLPKIASNPGFSVLHRTRCFSRYFQLVCEEPLPLSKIIKSPEVREWFASANVRDATAFSVVPVKRASGLTVLLVQPDFVREAHSGCYLLLNKRIDVSHLDSLSSEVEATDEPWVVEIGISIEADDSD
jgi:hypothetical protein